MNPFSSAELVDRLFGSFDAILTQWKQSAPTGSHLWEITHDKNAASLLEQDIRDIGSYFLRADDIGTRSEIFLMAECIAYLKIEHSEMTIPRRTEELTREIGESILHAADASTQFEETIFTPLSYRVAQFSFTQGIISEASLIAFRETIIQLADLFLLRDGNLTPEESERMKAFYDALNR